MSGIDRRDERPLLSHVCPPDWRNPQPAPVYDLVVIGGGTAGLVAAVGAAGLGARVALVERSRLGGDCLNAGCVPSKALLRAARAVHEAREASAIGVRTSVAVDFDAVMASVRAARVTLAVHDSAARLVSLGIDVFFGGAVFTTPRTADVQGITLRFRKAVLAAGSEPEIPAIDGLTPGMYLTTDSLFDVHVLPRSMAIVGAGASGCEMAQAFALLGTDVTLLDAAPRVLPREDPDASAVVQRALSRAGVTVMTGAAITGVGRGGRGVVVTLSPQTLSVDALLITAGRRPTLEGLNLAAAGVESDAGGVVVDDYLRTTNRRIFAAGDICSSNRYTHAADAMARLAIQNALFAGRRRASALLIPRCTYTIPEVAQVGETVTAGGGLRAVTVPLDAVDRAVIDRQADGFVRIIHDRGAVRGATIVAPHAGDLAGHVVSLIQSRVTLPELSRSVFAYPTLSEALRKAGDAYRRESLTPFVSRLLARYFALGRR